MNTTATRDCLRISVITPSLNQAQYLPAAIESVTNQEYPGLEYIIIDGGSTDGSVDIIKRFAHHLAHWVSEPDRGQSHAINKGFARATGDIVCWLNSDDLFLPGAFEKIGRTFVAFPHVQMVTGYTVRTDSQLRVLFNHFVPIQARWLAKHGVFYVDQPSTFWRRELLDRFGGLDETLHMAMDLDLWLRFLEGDVDIMHLREYLAVWRLHADCKSLKNGSRRDHEHVILRTRYEICDSWLKRPIARSLYRLWKASNGDYLRDVMFRHHWRGCPLSEFIHKVPDFCD